MKCSARTAIICTLILISISFAQAQPVFMAGGNIRLGFPQNEFKDNVENIGFGGTGYFALCVPQSPLSIGASFSFLIYGSETREEPFSHTIPDVFVDVTTSNNILLGHLLFRLQPTKGPLLPYAEGLLGFSYLWTSTRIQDQDDYDDEIASSTNFDDFTFNYGGGAGFMIRVYDGTQKVTDWGTRDIHGVYIDVGLRYIKGGEAEYLKKGSILIEDGDVSYDVKKSTTDLITFHVGATVLF